MSYFPNFIGQKNAISAITFELNATKRTKVLKPLFLAGPRGHGKTELARRIGSNLLNTEGKPKKFIELTGASCRNLNVFVDTLVIPHLSNFQEATLFVDEIHCVHDDIKDWFLSLLQRSPENKSTVSHAGLRYDFDFSKFSFICASTNPEKLSKSLLERHKRIELEPYVDGELIKILYVNTPDLTFLDGVEKEIISTVRGSPRIIVLDRSKDIVEYCAQNNLTKFGPSDWHKLRKILNIRPLGLTANETNILKFLKETGSQTLTSIAAKLSLDTSTVRRDCELFLLSRGLMKIEGTRHITDKGVKILAEYFNQIK
jgi:Holliday junction resolvasome RuvABC ATP-dependent DNA helicase subunit